MAEPTKQPTHIGLFEGIGGFSLAAHWAGYRTVAWSEWNPFCQQVLQYYFPEAEAHGDINQADFSKYHGTIDLLTAGFPCQPVSVAGNRNGTEDARWGWPATLRIIEQVQPRVVVLENVGGLLTILEPAGAAVVETTTNELLGERTETRSTYQQRRVLATIIEQLQSAGYVLPTLADGTAVVLCVPACAVNAPHRRDRIWIVGYAQHLRPLTPQNRRGEPQPRRAQKPNQKRQPTRADSPPASDAAHADCLGRRRKSRAQVSNTSRIRHKLEGGNSRNNATHASSQRQPRQGTQPEPSQTERRSEQRSGQSLLSGPDQQRRQKPPIEPGAIEPRQRDWPLDAAPSDFREFPTEPPLCGRNDGFPAPLVGITVSKHAISSIEAYGNAIVPQVAYEIIRKLRIFVI